MEKRGAYPPAASPLWRQALEKYLDELQGAEDYANVLQVHSLDELLASVSSLTTAHSGSCLPPINRLAPRLQFVDDFTAVLAVCFGADITLTAVVWGSIRLILSHASATAETLQDVLDMIEELSLTLPRLQVYKQTLPLSQPLQKALVDVYSEIICFYARTIHFLSSRPHLVLRKHAWVDFRNDFSRTILRIKRMSSTLESEADIVRVQKDEARYNEILDLLRSIKAGGNSPKIRYNNIPFPTNQGFSGRKDVLESVQKALGPQAVASSFKSMALFGMGGVGKTQIALQYAYQALDDFDVILWIAANSKTAINQSFHGIAKGLELPGAADQGMAMAQVKSWLLTTSATCLIIFDNANDLAALKTAWAGTVNCSVLLTTRDLTVATSLASTHTHVVAMDDNEGSSMFLNVIGLKDPSQSDIEHATAISRAFGGLPLALAQIAGLVTSQRIPLAEALPFYRRYSTRIDSRAVPASDYEYTLSTVWDASFEKLTERSARLLHLLSFLDPEQVAEGVLLEGSRGLGEEFLFLSDDLDLGDALEELEREALINRTGVATTLTIHPLIQSASRKKLSEPGRVRYLDAVTHLLSSGFPDHLSTDIGHQAGAWTRCETYLIHVKHVTELAVLHKYTPSDQKKYADLLLRCSWYLYEREMYIAAKEMVTQALSTFTDRTTLAYASALDLGGLIDLDLAHPALALEPFTQALNIRKTHLPPSDPFLAYSLNNLALAHTELGALDTAHAIHEEAIALRLAANSPRIGNSYSNMSSLLLRMGRPDEAEEMLARCPSLKDFTDETFLSTGNPRFSGDMVLLSRIRLAQGRKGEALRLATKALAFRRGLLGNRLKTCDSLYDVAGMLWGEGKAGSAVQLLEEIVSISESLAEGEGQLARALYKLSLIHAERGVQAESKACKDRALGLFAKLRPELRDAPFEEATFSELCLWMLW